MNQPPLPTISQQEIGTAAADPGGLIHLLVSRYRDILASDSSGQIQNHFTAEQNILLAFEVLDGQVCNGGFIQLIENGYGPYVFDTPLADHLREWGLEKTASLIEQAYILYEPKKDILERKKSLSEFARLYQEHPEFEPLDNEFYAIINGEKELLKTFIIQHLDKFALLG